MKKQKNINIKIGNHTFRKVEQMGLDELSTVRMAILAEMRDIQSALQGNNQPTTVSLLHTRAAIAQKQMQRVDQIGRRVITKAIPTVPQHLLNHGEATAAPTGA